MDWEKQAAPQKRRRSRRVRMKGMSSIRCSDEENHRQEDKQAKRNKRKRAKKNLLWPWEKDPRDTKEDVTLWGSLSHHVPVVVPTDPWMRGFALDLSQ